MVGFSPISINVQQRGFYLSLSLIPLGLLAWTFATTPHIGSKITRLIQSFGEGREELDRRNALHHAAVQQAARDRQLFATAPRGGHGIEIRHPE